MTGMTVQNDSPKGKGVYQFSMFHWLVGTLCFLCLVLNCAMHETIPGHLQPLGSHQKPKGVTMIGKFSRPNVFFRRFVEPGFPLLMREVLNLVNHPGLQNWTDSYLKEHFGEEMVNIENSKKENRQGSRKSVSLQQFLNTYQSENMYLVHSLTGKMTELVLLPETVQCGGFQQVLQEAVLWMGSGNTSSVLHHDGLDNLLCLMDGRKDVLLIDKSLKPLVEAEGYHPDGGYIDMDVDKVDMERFAHLRNIQWYWAPVQKGDCIFIPRGWYHQVRSSGERHMAVNLWLAHLWWFNPSDCTKDDPFSLKPLKDIGGFASPNEVYRSKLIESLENRDFANWKDLISGLKTTPERAAQFLNAIDQQKDPFISVRELYGFDIDKAVLKFPDVFGLPHHPVPGEEKEDIVLYTVSEQESTRGTQEETDELQEEEQDIVEMEELSGTNVQITEPDDIRSEERVSESEKYKDETERQFEAEGIRIDSESPDASLEIESEGSSLLPDEQVEQSEYTSDDSSDSVDNSQSAQDRGKKDEL